MKRAASVRGLFREACAVALAATSLVACNDLPELDGTSTPGRFLTGVVRFTPGEGGGFQAERLPGIVTGPPRGGGDFGGSLDVVSLGNAGEIVVTFAPNAIVDGPGVDLLVFENAFRFGAALFAEPGEISVSDDGVTWTSFPCDPSDLEGSACAGWRPVYADAETGPSPLDPDVAGGDPFDLASVGLARATFVKVRDLGNDGPEGKAGFDLDAMALVHAEHP